jgi:hypothetical protein
MVFSLVVVTFWRFDIGAIYAKGKGAQLAVGDYRLLGASTRATAKKMLKQEIADDDGMKPDGLLVIRTPYPDGARRAIELVASRLASEWRTTDPVMENELVRLDTFVRLKKDVDPAELVAELEARWSEEIAAAEYVPSGASSK